jgi:MoxR-like ATPase
MFNIWVDYPTLEEEMDVVKRTTTNYSSEVKNIISADEILFFQDLVRRIPVTDNLLAYAVKLVNKTRPNQANTPELVQKYLSWGAGPRASQYLIIGAKCHALVHGKFSPDIEDVKAIAISVLRHRIVRNYKAEAEGYSVDKIINELL